MAEADRNAGGNDDVPSDAPARRNIAAAALLLVVIAVVTALLLAIVVSAFDGTLTGERGIGRFFLLILDSDIDPKILTAITAIVGVGSSFVAGGGLSNRLFYTIVGVSAAGALFALIVWVLLSDDQLARNFYNYASVRLADAEAFRGAVHWVLGGTILWLLGVLGAQLGLRFAR